MSEEKKSFFPGRLSQVSVIVRDLDKAIANYKEVLGIEPTRVIEKSPAAPGKKYYNGKESDFFQRVALYYYGDVELEIQQPYGEASALSDFLKEHGEGVHHIAFDTLEFDKFHQHLEACGIPLIQSGPNSRSPYLHWGFYDAREKLGTMIEVTNFDEVKAIEAAQNK